ncbi:MAG: hypothetical protein ABI867_04380 [Kofleriaceae bacterium]
MAVLKDAAPYWWIIAMLGEHGYEKGWALVASEGIAKAVWKETEERTTMYYEYANPQVADLDGDGTDEILFTEIYGEGGMIMNLLVVGLHGDTPKRTLTWLGNDPFYPEQCSSSYTLVRAGGGVHVDIAHSAACHKPNDRLRWTGQALVPVT